MDVFKYNAFIYYYFIVFTTARVDSVPPDACFADFRWEDCGQAPVSVMYYWKPGSRCEVGLWRGCLPNINMFRDEYECVSTCIFTARAMPEDYHNIYVGDEEPSAGITPSDNATEPISVGDGTDSTTAGSGDKTDADGATTADVGDSDKGAEDKAGAVATSEGEAPTTAAPGGE